MSFKVSIILPVYNAEKFIAKAIESCLIQEEVDEVIIVDDGSTDDSLSICKGYSIFDKRVKVHRHSDLRNHGRSISRNLALSMVTNDYVAFLDADDYMLCDRFKVDKKVFAADSSIVGVYNAIGVHFYRDPAEGEENRLGLTTVLNIIKPEELFYKMLNGENGYFSIMGLTVKANIFKRIGFFDEQLAVGEDTLLILKMALICRLAPGILDKPVAMRGVHDNNVFTNRIIYAKSNRKLYKELFKMGVKNKVDDMTLVVIFRYICYRIDAQNGSTILKFITKIRWYGVFLFNCPHLLISKPFIRLFPSISH